MLVYFVGIFLFLGFFPSLYRFFAIDNLYYSALNKKIEDQSKIKSPRILIIGGSNLVFGVNSAQLAKEVGLPVYNLGLTAELGIPFMLKMAQLLSRKGDIILFSPEYLCADPSIRALAFVDLTCPSAPPFFNLSLQDNLRLQVQKTQVTLAALLRPYSSKADYNPLELYKSSGFNKDGDYVAHLHKPSPGFGKAPKVKLLAKNLIPNMEDFLAWLNESSINVFYLPQSYPITSYSENRGSVDSLFIEMKHIGWQPLCNPNAMVFADSLFFDTPNHLGGKGRELRTQRIATELKGIINSPYGKK